jgi:hypothetical protein
MHDEHLTIFLFRHNYDWKNKKINEMYKKFTLILTILIDLYKNKISYRQR